MNVRCLTANLDALRQAGCPVASDRLAGADDGEIVVDGTQVVDVALRTPDGPVRLDPSADPRADAARTLPPTARDAPLVVLVGAGVGYAIEALIAERFSGRIVVLEPSMASCLAALSRRDWTPLIAARRLRWLVGPDYEGWLDTWSWMTPGEVPAIVIHPVVGRLRGTDVRRALETLKKIVFNASANERARLQFSGRYLRHTLANLPRLTASRDIGELFGCAAGVPVAVLAAGPSLDRNLEALRPVRDRALVIAVDTALRPCLAAGIEPDLVVGVDPGESNRRHLAVGATPERTHLVAEPSLAPGSFDAFAGRVFTFRVSDHEPWPWLLRQGIDRASLRAWGSVLASALDLAVRIGGDPIVLLGADFAYTDGQPYCRNTAYEKDWAWHVAAGTPLDAIWRTWTRDAIEATDIHGRPVATTPHLVAFRDWIADYCRNAAGVSIVNGTGAGLLGSVPQVRVDDLLRDARPIDVSPLIHPPVSAVTSVPAMDWWDGSMPPQPWTRWAESTNTSIGALVSAASPAMPGDQQVSLLRAALRGDARVHLPQLMLLMAHAYERTGEVFASQQLFAACQRRGWLPDGDVRARASARETTLAAAAHLALARHDSAIGEARYASFVEANAAPDDAPVATRRPDFIVAGSAYCGVALLYDFIASSSSVWTRRPKVMDFFSRVPELGLPFYAQFFEACPNGLRCGEVSPSYFDDAGAADGSRGEADIAGAIAEACPTTRIIVMLRDPAARAIAYHGDRPGGGASAPLSSDDPIVATGKFERPLRRFTEAFGERLLVLTVADLRDAAALSRRLADFLSIEPPDPAALRIHARDRLLLSHATHPRYDGLREYYAPTLRALERAFGLRL